MWIELKDKLPKVSESVLICTEKGCVCSGYLSKRYENLWVLHDQEITEKVIAWQPLPKHFHYNKGDESGNPSARDIDDFTDDEVDIGDVAFAQCQDHIKEVVHNYLIKDEITLHVRKAIRDGVCEYFEGCYGDLVRDVSFMVARQIENSLECEVTVKRNK